jgi:hypothetical protein
VDEFFVLGNQKILAGSEAVYLNGLLLEVNSDYTMTFNPQNPNSTEISFTNAPQSGDKVVVYGVYFS